MSSPRPYSPRGGGGGASSLSPSPSAASAASAGAGGGASAGAGGGASAGAGGGASSMPPSADAFELLPVLPSIDQGRAKIRALGVFGADHVYVGTDDGRVLLHVRQRTQEGEEAEARLSRGAAAAAAAGGGLGGDSSDAAGASSFSAYDPFVLVRERYLGRKRDVVQLHVMGDLNRVVCRVDGGYMDVLHMVTLEIQSQGIPQSKHVSVFVVEQGTPLYRVAVITSASRTRRSKLFLYEFASSAVGFAPLRDPIELPEGVVCAEFFRGVLCLGFYGKARKEYRLLNVDTLEDTELFPLDTCKSPPHIQVVGEELLLVRDELGLFIDAAGQLVTSHNNIIWSTAPSVVGFKDPYVVSLQEKSKGFEVHNILTQQLIQTIPFPMKNMRFIVGTQEFPFMLLASNMAVFCANKKTTARQISDLLALKRTQDAIILAEYELRHAKAHMGGGSDPRQAALTQLLRTLAGSGDVLFGELDFQSAFECWSKCLPRSGLETVAEDDVMQVALRRFPNFAGVKFDARNVLLRFPRLLAATENPASGAVGTSVRQASSILDIESAVRRKLRVDGPGSDEILEKHRLAAQRELVKFLRVHAARSVAVLRAIAQGRLGAETAPPALADVPLLCDIHTALIYLLLRPGVATDPSAVLDELSEILHTTVESRVTPHDDSPPLLFFHPAAAERLATEAGDEVFRGVVLAVQFRHEDALRIWQQICESASSSPRQKQASLDQASSVLTDLYLNTHQAHPNNYSRTQLLWDHGIWVLEQLGSDGVRKVFCRDPKVGSPPGVPARAVAEFLRGKFGEAFLQPFLEFQVLERHSVEGEFHTSLGKMLADAALREVAAETYMQNKMRDVQSSGAVIDRGVDTMRLATPSRTRLKALLETSDFYERPEMHRLLQGTPLVPELIVVLSRQSEHRQALELLVRRLQDFPAAEAYCTRYKQDDPGLTLELFKVYLHEGDGETPTSVLAGLDPEPMAGPPKEVSARALRLLHSHSRELAPQDVLPLLPVDMPLAKLSEYLRRSITHSHTTLRSTQIAANLMKTDDIKLRYRLALLQNKEVVVDEDTICRVCQKRIGSTVFAWYPNSSVVHFRCQGSNPAIDPVTGADFSKWQTREQYFSVDELG